jgi:hypothetical protein
LRCEEEAIEAKATIRRIAGAVQQCKEMSTLRRTLELPRIRIELLAGS